MATINNVLKTLVALDSIKLMEAAYEETLKNLLTDDSSLAESLLFLNDVLDIVEKQRQEKDEIFDGNKTCVGFAHLLNSIFDGVCIPILYSTHHTETEKINHKTINILSEILIHCLRMMCKENTKQIFNMCNKSLTEYINSMKYGLDVSKQGEAEVKHLMHPVCAIIVLKHVVKFQSGIDENRKTGDDDLKTVINKTKEILSCCSEQFGSTLLTSLVSELISLNDGAMKMELLEMLLQVSFSYFSLNYSDSVTKRTGVGYLILTYLWQHLKPLTKDDFFRNLCHDCKLWHIIQQGLVHQDPLNRKRALFLMQELLHIFEDNTTFFAVNGKRFVWNKGENWMEIWSNFFLLLESLEERQIHVIKPVLPRFDKLIATTKYPQSIGNKNSVNDICLHLSWVTILYQRMFVHESKFINRWAVSHFLNLKLNKEMLTDDQLEEFIFHPLLNILNDPSLFALSDDDSNDSCPLVARLFLTFMQNCCNVLKNTEQSIFFRDLLKHMMAITWNTVSLLYFAYALSQLPRMFVWNSNCISTLRHFICNTLKTQDTFLRAAIQCFFLEALMKLIDITDMSFEVLADVLSVFKSDECLKRGTKLWTRVSVWLRETVATPINSDNENSLAKENAFLFCENISNKYAVSNNNAVALTNIEPMRAARLVILFLDADVLIIEKQKPFSCIEIFSPVIRLLSCITTRLYLCEDNLNNCLKFFNGLIDAADANNNEPLQSFLIEWLEPCAEEIFCHIFRKLPLSVTKLEDVDHLELLVDILEKLVKIPHYKKFLHKNIGKFTETCCSTFAKRKELETTQKSEFQFQTYAAAKCLALICKNRFVVHDKLIKFLSNEIIPNLDKPLKKLDVDSSSNGLHQNRWGRIVSDYLCCLWQCFEYHLLDHVHILSSAKIVCLALEALSISADIAGIVCKCLKPYLLQLMDSDCGLFSKVLARLWTTIFERRKADFFWLSLKQFVEMAFQPSLMNHSKAQLLHKYSDEAFRLSDSAPNVFCIFVFHCCKSWSKTNNCGLEQNLSILRNALIFGCVHRKDQKVPCEAALFANSLGHNCSANYMIDSNCLDDTMVRVAGIGVILKLSPQDSRDQKIACDLAMLLLEHEKSLTGQRTRYFGNSLIHRVKNRIWQLILILEPLCSESILTILLEAAYEELSKEGTQPSVRLYQEWLSVRILLRFRHLREYLWTAMEKASSVRVGSVGSFLAIITHLAKGLTDPLDQEAYILMALPKVLSWCLAQNFNVRVTAQMTYHQLWQISKERCLYKVIDEYKIIDGCVNFTLENGYSKNMAKLMDDFYYRVFHCLEHFSLETIFYDFPRLSCLTSDEWITPALLQQKIPENLQVSNMFIRVQNQDRSLSNYSKSAWIKKSSDFNDDNEIVISSSNIQKKPTPWKHLLMDEHGIILEESEKCSLKQDGLIVVASIIERVPNLGGLCRTCEIFGASEYVIGSLKFVEDKQFQNLSVSSERWIPMKEVKRHQLKEYLGHMRDKGYTLVGAEQTAYSCQLNEYRFPKKTLLLLGNEKEGIPAELIQFLDVCLEIPQRGVIRSLNVHVSGAVIIWEYARQHVFQNLDV